MSRLSFSCKATENSCLWNDVALPCKINLKNVLKLLYSNWTSHACFSLVGWSEENRCLWFLILILSTFVIQKAKLRVLLVKKYGTILWIGKFSAKRFVHGKYSEIFFFHGMKQRLSFPSTFVYKNTTSLQFPSWVWGRGKRDYGVHSHPLLFLLCFALSIHSLQKPKEKASRGSKPSSGFFRLALYWRDFSFVLSESVCLLCHQARKVDFFNLFFILIINFCVINTLHFACYSFITIFSLIRYGEIFKTHILGCRCVMLASPEAIKFVLVTKASLFKPTYPPSKEKLIGPWALFFQQGDYHSQMRKLVKSSLSLDVITNLVPSIEVVVISALDSISGGKVVHTFHEMKKVGSV